MSDVPNNASEIEEHYFSLRLNLSKYIVQYKAITKQLALCSLPQKRITFRERILTQLKQEYPKAFEVKRKRIRNQYGQIQMILDFPIQQPKTLLVVLGADLDDYNPLSNL